MKKYCLCFGVVCCLLIGCYSNPSEVNAITSIQELDEVIQEMDKVIVEISKDGCFYCMELKKVENKIKTDIPIYKYIIDENTTDQDIEYLEMTFQPLKYIPAFYNMSSKEVRDYIVVSDWDNPIKEINNWIKNQ